MRVTRFMSRAEWEAFERGETLIYRTDHFNGGQGGSRSVGFCFTEHEPAVAWRYLAGAVDADVWATFEFPDGYLSKTDGKYSDKSGDPRFFDFFYSTGWYCTSYNNTIAKVIDKCVPFKGGKYRAMKAFREIISSFTRCSYSLQDLRNPTLSKKSHYSYCKQIHLTMKIKFKKLTESAIMPTKATAGSAAYDLYADSDTIVLPGRGTISTGIAIELPNGYLADVRPRSGYSLKGFAGNDSARFDCDVLLGTIDSDYRGGINVIVRNNEMAFNVKAGQRIAQLLIHKSEDVEFEEVDELAPSIRDFKGFGSSGD